MKKIFLKNDDIEEVIQDFLKTTDEMQKDLISMVLGKIKDLSKEIPYLTLEDAEKIIIEKMEDSFEEEIYDQFNQIHVKHAKEFTIFLTQLFIAKIKKQIMEKVQDEENEEAIA